MIWDQTMTTRLQVCVEQGMSGNQIAREFGTSRCSVISKCIRMGFRLQGTRPRKTPEPSAQTRRSNSKLKVQGNHSGAPTVPLPILSENLVSLLDLKPSCCRFPYGDPRKPGFSFCGNERAPGLPYCPGHARIAYQPVPLYQRRRS